MLNKPLALALAVLALTGLAFRHSRFHSQQSLLRAEFVRFKNSFRKTYQSLAELEYRFGVFRKSLDFVRSVNSDRTKTFSAGINKFSDLTFDEFKAKYLVETQPASGQPFADEPASPSVPAVDWRKSPGAVQPVKDQRGCASGYAFSATATLEFAVWKLTGQSARFSNQELVDCSSGDNWLSNKGCDGGSAHFSYSYIHTHQLGTEESYPYTADYSKCDQDNVAKPGRQGIQNWTNFRAGVNTLTQAVQSSVVSVTQVVKEDFKHYESGVYSSDDPDCGFEPSQIMAIVGYDTTASVPYYIVRNSWGTGWGEQGYARVAIGQGLGTCRIAGYFSYIPVI